MRILYLIRADAIGGAEKQLSDIVCHFKNKFETIIVASFSKMFLRDNYPTRIRSIELARRNLIKSTKTNYINLRNIIKDENIEVVQYFHRIFIPIIWLIKFKFRNIKIVYSATSVFNDLLNFFITADYYLAVSDAVMRNLLKYFNVEKNKIIIIKHGIRLDNFEFCPLASDKRVMNSLTVGYAGRLEKSKGVKYLLFLIKELKEFPIKLIIQGDGSQKDKLKGLVKRLDIHDKVTFYDWNNNLKDFFRKIDIFILPSLHHEGFGLVLLEALASGKFIIATKVGGITEIIHHNDNGYLVESKDIQEMKNLILKIYYGNFDSENLLDNVISSSKNYILEDKLIEYEVFYSKIYTDIITTSGGQKNI